jgi:hypothetical protein
MNKQNSPALTIKRVTPSPKAKKEVKTKAKAKKGTTKMDVTSRNETNLLETVISNRKIKYKYPEGIEDTLSRKSWRQQVRNQLEKLELDMLRIKDQDGKEYKKAKKAYEDYYKSILKA